MNQTLLGRILKMRPKASLPPIRKMFAPDTDQTFFSVDLDRADFQVVMWEADDKEGKEMLRAEIDIWLEEAKKMWGPNANSKQRYQLKQGAHATDYGGTATTAAKAMNCTVREAEWFQHRWFQIHPGIRQWHERIQGQLESIKTPKTVWNAFGYSISFQERIDRLLPRALAWIPQSTVGLIINYGWVNVERNIPDLASILNQVHDELLGQYPTSLEEKSLTALRRNLLIEVPYSDPLVIPVGIKTSTQSWGHVKEREWPDGKKTGELAAELFGLHKTLRSA